MANQNVYGLDPSIVYLTTPAADGDTITNDTLGVLYICKSVGTSPMLPDFSSMQELKPGDVSSGLDAVPYYKYQAEVITTTPDTVVS